MVPIWCTAVYNKPFPNAYHLPKYPVLQKGTPCVCYTIFNAILSHGTEKAPVTYFFPTCLCSDSRWSRNVAAAQVGSCCCSRSCLSRLAEEVEGKGVGVAIGLGDLVEPGAMEVDGDGSKPFKRNQVCLNYSKFVAVKSICPAVTMCLQYTTSSK